MTRREILFGMTAASLGVAKEPEEQLSVEGYIFQQYAQTLNKPLRDVIAGAFEMSRAAGFKNIELNQAFFAADIREQSTSLLRSYGFSMPSVYVGGAMHDAAGASQTIARALEIGEICAPFGCKAIVTNPDPKAGDSEKTDAELGVEADSLNRMGQVLSGRGFQLRVHHHTPQLTNNAREWRYILRHTDPQYVSICVDVDWAYEGGFEPLAFLREVGPRLREIHVRSARNKLWLEDLEDSDIDYRAVAAYLQQARLEPLIVVELAYRTQTAITRPLKEDLALSYRYAQKVFDGHEK
jgi:inosose dehydratase